MLRATYAEPALQHNCRSLEGSHFPVELPELSMQLAYFQHRTRGEQTPAGAESHKHPLTTTCWGLRTSMRYLLH